MSIKSIFVAGMLFAMIGTSAVARALIYCSEGSPDGFDPALYTSVTTFDAASKPIYDRLVEFKVGTTEVIPGLAESWEVAEDSMSVTFNLRRGVKFHANADFTPSRDLNVDDVIFSFDRQANPDNAYNAISGGTWDYFSGMAMPALIASMEKIDNYTVKFNLTRPYASFIANLAMDFASIVSKEYADAMMEAGTPEMVNQAPIGTGPFAFQSYQEDVVIRYLRNDDYWGDAAKVERLIFAITPDASSRYQKVLAGECHIMAYPNPTDISAMRATEDIIVMEQEKLNIGYLAYNTTMPPFDNVNVRKALNMAINKQAIIDVVFQGAGQIAKNPIPPTMWSYDESTVDDPYDPDAAKALLTAEGVFDLDLKIWAMPVQRPYNPNARRMAELMQEDFSKIGVNVEIVSYEWGEYIDRSKDIDRDGAVLLGWTGDNGDPDNFLSILLGCENVAAFNHAHWCNAEFDALVQEARTLTKQEERAPLYEQAQAIFKREAPWATLTHSVVFMPMRPEVENYVVDPLGGHSFNQVSIAQ